MPDYTVSGDVDSMLRSANDAAIRSAIGVGTTDAPTFLAQTLTGQSLTGTQATSLVDLATTWNTSGTPSALKLNVTETGAGSNFSSLLLDCQTGGTSRFRVTKNGAAVAQTVADNGGVFSAGSNGFKNIQFGGLTYNSNGMVAIRDPGLVVVRDLGGFCWENGTQNPATGTIELSLFKDAAGILAQRNGTAKQALRVYNTALSGAPEWAEFDWITSGGTNTLRIGTNLSGTGAARPIEFVTGGVVRMSISGTGAITFISNVNFSADIRSTSISNANSSLIMWQFVSDGTGTSTYAVGGSAPLMRLGGTTSAFPAIKRNGTGIDIRLADDSGPAPLAAAKLELVTTAATGVRESILRASVSDNATSAFHIYNATFADGKFVPGFSGSVFDSTTPASLFFAGQTDAANDTGTSPLMIFTARTTTSTTDPNNGINGSVTTRPLFTWWNNNATQMQMSANGNLGIGTTTPASKLQVTAGDIEVDTVTNGIILKAAGTSTRYRITLNAGGTALVFTAV